MLLSPIYMNHLTFLDMVKVQNNNNFTCEEKIFDVGYFFGQKMSKDITFEDLKLKKWLIKQCETVGK